MFTPSCLRTLIWLLFTATMNTALFCAEMPPRRGVANNGVHMVATGTGQTTWHIANMSIHNTTDGPVMLAQEIFYIASDGSNQSYVGWPEGSVVILPGQRIVVPVYGYCADVHTPPVRNGEPMPSRTSWIPVGSMPTTTGGGETLTVRVNEIQPVPSFTPADIPGITSGDEYQPSRYPETGKTVITWPGTAIPVGGTLRPGSRPQVIASVLVPTLKAIETAAALILADKRYPTPFSADSLREFTSVVQQTFWIFTGALSGDEYQEDDFREKVYDQFQTNTQTNVRSLPEDQRKELDQGIAQFWNSFSATGVEAKVLKKPESDPVHKYPISTQTLKDTCILSEEIDPGKEMLDYAIANTGTKEKNEKVREAFRKAIAEAAGMVAPGNRVDSIDVGFTTPEMPASAWSLYFPHIVAGRANATAMAIDVKDPLKSAFTTEPLTTKANGAFSAVLTHQTGPECTSVLVGVNLAKLRAASGLNASLGNIEALRVINFIGEVAIDIVIQRGKGTLKKLGKYFKDKLKDMAKDQAKEFVKEEMKRIADQLKGKSEEEAEKTMDELLEKMKSGELEKEEQAEEAEDELLDVLADVLIDGEEFNPAEKITDDLKDKVDSPIDWSPIQTNTYAIAEGSLEVFIDDVKALAKTGSGVRYKRKGLEDKEEAEKGGGVFCKEAVVSKTTSGTITAKTTGKVETRAGATGEGIFSTGHGIATATLESFNGIYVIAICICPAGVFYENFLSVTGFSNEPDMTDIWTRVFENLLNDVRDQVGEDSKQWPGMVKKAMPADYPKSLEKKMVDAAQKASSIILPCDKKKK